MISRNHQATARQKRWHAWLADQPCCNCYMHEVSIHHCAGASAKHDGVWIGQDWVLPLCYDCHQGHQGIHGDRQRFGGEPSKEAEKRLFLELVEDAVLFGLPDVPPPDVLDAIEVYHK